MGEMRPVLKLDPAGEPGRGPAGTMRALNAGVGDPLPLKVWFTTEGEIIEDGEGPHLVRLAWST